MQAFFRNSLKCCMHKLSWRNYVVAYIYIYIRMQRHKCVYIYISACMVYIYLLQYMTRLQDGLQSMTCIVLRSPCWNPCKRKQLSSTFVFVISFSRAIHLYNHRKTVVHVGLSNKLLMASPPDLCLSRKTMISFRYSE